MKVTEISLLRVKREGQLAHMLPNRGHQPLDADSIFPLIQFRVATTNEELTHGHTESRALKFKVKVEQKKFKLVKDCEVVQVAPAVLITITSCRAQDSLENFRKAN